MNISRFRPVVLALVVPWLWLAHGQTVNSGSNGSDGAFNPTTNTVVDMAHHPDGIYHYTSVDIPTGVTVSFIPNAKNTPVVWLVQGDCRINGVIDVAGKHISDAATGSAGGPGGFRGGDSGTNPKAGQGPGGGPIGMSGSHATQPSPSAAPTYGNVYLVPLIGGSGGGGFVSLNGGGGGGGGGAILIASSIKIEMNGAIRANGEGGGQTDGSGGAVRFIATTITGTGYISVRGYNSGGLGRIRFDAYANNFAGQIDGVYTQGFQPIILPVAGQGIQLAIASVAGGSVPANPSSSLANPAVIVPAQQAGSVPVVVQCFNVPLNTPITVTARPANGAAVSANGFNSSGTAAASTATVNLNLPRGSGILMAKATVAVAQGASGGLENPRSREATGSADFPVRSAARLADLPLSVTGLTTDGERIAAVEVEATLGGGSRTVYVTESGKRIPAPSGK